MPARPLPYTPPHLLHFLVGWLTCGLWWLVWPFAVAMGQRRAMQQEAAYAAAVARWEADSALAWWEPAAFAWPGRAVALVADDDYGVFAEAWPTNGEPAVLVADRAACIPSRRVLRVRMPDGTEWVAP